MPAAEVKFTMEEDDNGNYLINISAENMAHAEHLDPSRDLFVVWSENSKYGTYNIGALIPDKKLKASLNTLTPYEPDRIFITSEKTSKVRYPGSEIVFTLDLN